MGIDSAPSILPNGRSRIPFPDLRTETASQPRWPSRRDASSSLRYGTRARKLSLEQESAIRALAGTRSLRSLAADFWVSHETIRMALRSSAPVLGGSCDTGGARPPGVPAGWTRMTKARVCSKENDQEPSRRS
jgi:hypothetical protein